VLCHGFLDSKNGSLMRNLSDGITGNENGSGDWAVCRVDFSGCGESQGPWSASGYFTEREDLRCVVEHLRAKHGLDVCAILGHSRGALVSLLYQAKYNDMGLVIAVSSPLDVKRRISGLTTEELDSLRAGTTIMMMAGTKEFPVTWEDVELRESMDVPSQLAKIQTGTMVIIHGEMDESVPISESRALTDILQQQGNCRVEMAVLQGADHNFRRDHRICLVDLVRSWLRTVDGLESCK